MPAISAVNALAGLLVGGNNMERFSAEQLAQLGQPPTNTKQNQGFSYIPHPDMYRSANAIFGVGGWDTEVREVRERELIGQGGAVVGIFYYATVRVTLSEGVVSEDVGTGFVVLTAYNSPGAAFGGMNSAVKDAVTDGVKRALHRFGNYFGLGLYDGLPSAPIAPPAQQPAAPAPPPQQPYGQGGYPQQPAAPAPPPQQPATGGGVCQSCGKEVGVGRDGQPYRFCFECNERAKAYRNQGNAPPAAPGVPPQYSQPATNPQWPAP